MVKVECRDVEAAPAASLKAAVEGLVAGLRARDQALSLAGLAALVVVDDFPAALAHAGVGAVDGALAQAVTGPAGAVLYLDGRRLAAILAGPPEELARLAHLLHRELWRIQEAARRQAQPAPVANEFEGHLVPVVEGLWAEYASARRGVWTLPADADLLLPHLAGLLEALPPATLEDSTLALAAGEFGDLFARALGRVTHLMQVVGQVQGYLAGLGRSVESLAPELATPLRGSFLGPRWDRLGRLLEALHGSAGQWDGEFLHNTLRPEVLAVFAALGLDLQPDADGGVWLEPRPGGPAQRLH